ALESGACHEAIVHLSRALEIMRGPAAVAPPASPSHPLRRFSVLDPNDALDPDSPEFRLGMLESCLTEAYFRLGDLPASGQHAERALRHFGQYVPSRALPLVVDTVRQSARHGLQAVFGVQPADRARSRRVAAEVARVHVRFVEACFSSVRL